jgi:hypothetical protein
MKPSAPRAFLWLSLALLFGGCASYDAHVVQGHSLTGLQRFFIVTGPNDNHAIDHRIAEALQARGGKVEIGPLTMMPEDTQGVITYQDRWAWDFGEHLVYLQIDVREPEQPQSFATVNFTASVPLREDYPVTVNRLVEKLFGQPASAAFAPPPKMQVVEPAAERKRGR